MQVITCITGKWKFFSPYLTEEFPIWWGQAPKIIYTFLESYDFSGKTILPFCTSASSPLGTSASNLHAACAESVRWLEGRRFASGTSKETVQSWLLEAGLPLPGEGKCEHIYKEEITTEPTCTKNGEKTYTCSLCGDSYTVPIPALGHKYKTEIVPATTLRDGSITKKCTACHAVESQNIIFSPKTMKLSKTSYTYNGKERKPVVTIMDSQGKPLKAGTDYAVTYPKNAKDTGIYRITVQFRGNYSGAMTETFSIKPKSIPISKLTPKKRGFLVKWNRQKQKVSGYEISYSSSKKFTKKTTQNMVLGKGSITSRTIPKLKAKQKYYVKLRAFRTVKVNGKSQKLYSGWSKVKAVTTKK